MPRFLSCLLMLLLPVALAAADKERLNVVLFLADDLGAHDLGCTGSTFYETPNIDRLAKDGTLFTRAYAACPVCSPTRASLMTGKYPQRVGVTDYIGAPQPGKWNRPTKMLPAPYKEELALEETTLAEALKAAGYATMHAGKWHLGKEPFWPEHQGFDVNRGGIDKGGPYGGNKYFSPFDNPRLTDGKPGEHISDRLADECAAFIEANKEKPFFVNYWLYDVHTPHMAKDDLKKKYEAKAKALPKPAAEWGREGERKVRLVQDHAVYAGMVETMDGAVGRVLRKLDELKLAGRTLVIFTSDNGGLSTSEGWPTSNLPLRGGKGWLYEGGVRVPLVVRWPGMKPGVSDHVAITPDLFATVLEACGLPATAKDGVSFAGALRGEAAQRGPVYWHYPHYGNQGGFPGSALRDGDWKLIERFETGALELYNLATDPGEARDLAAGEPGRVKELKVKLDAWRKDVGAKYPTPKKPAP